MVAPSGMDGDDVEAGTDRADAPASGAEAKSSEPPASAPAPSTAPSERDAGAEITDKAAIANGLAARAATDPKAALQPEKAKSPRRLTAAEGLLAARYGDGALIAGRYRIEGKIARGGMAMVFLATQLPLGRKVAVKIVSPQHGDDAFRERFLLEASTTARLSHPNIVVVYDYGQTDHGDLYQVMEYLGRRSLARVLYKNQRVEPARACGIALQICRALRLAHRRGVVHRDLKPSNVMILDHPEAGPDVDLVKVVDFGLVRILRDEAEDVDRLTRAGTLLGSPRYMSPEQVRNYRVDHRADIYSLGIITYQMLCGRPPFDSEHQNEVLAQQLRDPAPPLSVAHPDVDVPPELEAMVMRCLCKRPSDRYQDIEEVIAQLDEVLGILGADASLATFAADHPSNPSVGDRTPPFPTPSIVAVETTSPEPVPPTFDDGDASRSVSASPSAEPATLSAWWAVVILLTAVVGSLVFWAVLLR